MPTIALVIKLFKNYWKWRRKCQAKKCFYQKHLSTICCCPREFAVIAQVWRNFCVTSLDPLCSPGAAHGYSNGLKANRGSLLNAETICAIKKAQGSYKKEESLWKITPCTGCPEFERKRAFGFQIVFYKKNRNLFQMNISLGNSSWTAVLLFGDFGRLFCWGLWWSGFFAYLFWSSVFFPLHCHLCLLVSSLLSPALLTKAEPSPRLAQVHILGRFAGVQPPARPNQGPEQLQQERTIRMRNYPGPE